MLLTAGVLYAVAVRFAIPGALLVSAADLLDLPLRSDASLSVGRRCVSCLNMRCTSGRSCSRERPLVNAIRWTDNKTKSGESGTYEVTGSDLVIHRTVAFIPANMVPNNAGSFSFDEPAGATRSH